MLRLHLDTSVSSQMHRNMDLGLLVRLVNIVKLNTNSTIEQDQNIYEDTTTTAVEGMDQIMDCSRLFKFIFSVFQCCYDDKDN